MHIRRRPAAPFSVMHLACIPAAADRLPTPPRGPSMQPKCISDQPFPLARPVCIKNADRTVNMTGFGKYARDTVGMFNIELARIIQTEREQEIQAELRRRRLLGANKERAVSDERSTPAPRLQRRPSGASSR